MAHIPTVQRWNMSRTNIIQRVELLMVASLIVVLLSGIATASISSTESIDIIDTDGDRLYDIQEIMFGTDEQDPDTDSDGLPDGWEVIFGRESPITHLPTVDPTDPNDAHLDADNDGLTNLEEFQYDIVNWILDPNNNDTDGDGILDGDEVANGTDPFDGCGGIAGCPSPLDPVKPALPAALTKDRKDGLGTFRGSVLDNAPVTIGTGDDVKVTKLDSIDSPSSTVVVMVDPDHLENSIDADPLEDYVAEGGTMILALEDEIEMQFMRVLDLRSFGGAIVSIDNHGGNNLHPVVYGTLEVEGTTRNYELASNRAAVITSDHSTTYEISALANTTRNSFIDIESPYGSIDKNDSSGHSITSYCEGIPIVTRLYDPSSGGSFIIISDSSILHEPLISQADNAAFLTDLMTMLLPDGGTVVMGTEGGIGGATPSIGLLGPIFTMIVCGMMVRTRRRS